MLSCCFSKRSEISEATNIDLFVLVIFIFYMYILDFDVFNKKKLIS